MTRLKQSLNFFGDFLEREARARKAFVRVRQEFTVARLYGRHGRTRATERMKRGVPAVPRLQPRKEHQLYGGRPKRSPPVRYFQPDPPGVTPPLKKAPRALAEL